MKNNKERWVLARACPDCTQKPNAPAKLSFLVTPVDPTENEDTENVKYVDFKTENEAYEYAEDVLGENPEDVLVMPLSEVDPNPIGGHDHD